MVLICGQTQAAVMAANDRTSVVKKGATKHCCWGKCRSDSRYLEKSPPGTYFVRFPKPGKIKDTMTEWEKGQQNRKTDKCRKWVDACGRKDFTVDNVKKDTYMCSIHFIGNHGPTEQYPNPILATWTGNDLNRKLKRRKPLVEREISSGPAKKKQLIEPNLLSDDFEDKQFQDTINAKNGNVSSEDSGSCSLVTHDKATQTPLDNSFNARRAFGRTKYKITVVSVCYE